MKNHEDTNSPLKWLHPKILLIDMGKEEEALLKAEGYFIASGSFGIPYKVPQNDILVPVIMQEAKLPDYTEQEIIIIDLVAPKATVTAKGEKHTSKGENDWWASCSEGVIDPRPRTMNSVQKTFDRIATHGGIFIVFSSPRILQKIIWGHLTSYDALIKDDDITADSWSFLSVLDSEIITVKNDHGKEITVLQHQSPMGHLLSEHVKGAWFLSTFNLTYTWSELKDRFVPLALNKYGAVVAAAIKPSENYKAWIFLFPQLSNKPQFLSSLLKDILPELSPQLFPQFEGAQWVQRPEYELMKIIDFKNNIKKIQEEAVKKVAALEDSIKKERKTQGYMHDLIRETGPTLVDAVKKGLELIGFKDVINMDEEVQKQSKPGNKNEDLQLRDSSPLLLIEVKGITGLPRDAAALQVGKYVAPRMRELGRTDIQGLSIINHQRNLPAIDRENRETFRNDILINSQEQGFGLLTTWDFYRLIRSFIKNNWTADHVAKLLYKIGRIDPVPDHYEYVGHVEHYWEQPGAVGIRCEGIGIKKGDRISFELPVEFEEQVVDSLHEGNSPVQLVLVGALAGIKTHLTKEQLKKGVRVFLVRITV